MDQVIVFDKSLQERLQEYLNVLSNDDILSVSKIKSEWSFYLKLVVDPDGWQAIWKIPRSTCESLKIPFPNLVLVYVQNIIFNQLSAVVRVLVVQNDIHICEKHVVSLCELWPTKEQDESIGLKLDSTANSIDMIRFFYTNLFMPWDLEDDDTSDWLDDHLISRLRLYYDIKNGVIPKTQADHLKSLISEAKHLDKRREQLELDLSDSDREDVNNVNTENKKVQEIIDIQVRMMQIRHEFKFLENPLTRNVLLRFNQKHNDHQHISKELRCWLIFEHGKIDEYISFLNDVKQSLSDEVVTFSSTLLLALESASCNDTIILNRSRHLINLLGDIARGGTISGLYGKTDTVLCSVKEDVVLDLCGNITISNLTVDAGSSQYGILVRHGKVTLKNCKIIGDGESSTQHGIIVLAGGSLVLVDCDISNFNVAVTGNSGSTIHFKQCEIFGSAIGLKIYDACKLSVENSSFHDCEDYGIYVETDKFSDGNQCTGLFTILTLIPDVTIQDLTGINNKKGDVLINKKPLIKPIRNLFARHI